MPAKRNKFSNCQYILLCMRIDQENIVCFYRMRKSIMAILNKRTKKRKSDGDDVKENQVRCFQIGCISIVLIC